VVIETKHTEASIRARVIYFPSIFKTSLLNSERHSVGVPAVRGGPVPAHVCGRRDARLAPRQHARPLLANPRAQETAVVLQTHLAAGEKIRDRCDRLFAGSRAGTYRHDEIA